MEKLEKRDGNGGDKRIHYRNNLLVVDFKDFSFLSQCPDKNETLGVTITLTLLKSFFSFSFSRVSVTFPSYFNNYMCKKIFTRSIYSSLPFHYISNKLSKIDIELNLKF